MTTEPTESIDTNDGDGTAPVKDGLSGRVEPLAREAVDAVGPEAGAEPGSANDSRAETENSSGSPDDVEGLNKAAGPAQESNDQAADSRSLTTDTSPSD
ncbi:hypothetical protein M1E17_03865 [Arthrobacter sp. D1-29]